MNVVGKTWRDSGGRTGYHKDFYHVICLRAVDATHAAKPQLSLADEIFLRSCS